MIICIICGKEVPKHKPGWKQSETCSRSCGTKLGAQRRKAHGFRPWNLKYVNGMPELICQKCGKPFTMKHYYKARYCSRKCAHTQPKGDRSWAWKGGRTKRGGYVLVYTPNHPQADKSGYVPEHRLVMEAHLGRLLKKDEKVHHVNANRGDNRIENLQLLSVHCHLKCPFCGKKFNPSPGTFI